MSTQEATRLMSVSEVSSAVAPLSPVVGVFTRTTHAERAAQDLWYATIDPRWNVLRGPNGGFLAALLLATMQRRLDDAGRHARVLSLHYPKVPAPGAVEIRTQLTRSGRSMSWLSAELYQDDELCVAARAAFSADWPSVEYDKTVPPELPEGPGLDRLEGLPPFTSHYRYRSLFATPMASGSHDAVGGYIRLREPEPYSTPLLAAMSDAWFPSTFAHDRRPTMGATLDLTVHFRDGAALAQLRPEEELLSVFRSRLATQGFFEEDGELWSASGKLLAQSRQLAIAAPYGSSLSKR